MSFALLTYAAPQLVDTGKRKKKQMKDRAVKKKLKIMEDDDDYDESDDGDVRRQTHFRDHSEFMVGGWDI